MSSPLPSDGPASAGAGTTAPGAGWRVNAGLFVATVLSCFWTSYSLHEPGAPQAVLEAAQFTAALLGILLAHEFGHYIAARIHGVDASLPYFLPMPLVSPFGTMGAVIRMRAQIPTRRALLDIGAAGPLAGLCVAIPLYAWGVARSQLVEVVASTGSGSIQLGNSLLLRLLDRTFGAPVPPGMDIELSPVAFAAWAGMFVTMINLIPAGQLDAGHVAYALLGSRQNRLAVWVHRSMLAFFAVSLVSFVARDVSGGFGLHRLGRHIQNSTFWLVWFEVLAILGTVSGLRGNGGNERSERDDGQTLGVRPRIIGTLGLALLAGLLHERPELPIWLAWLAGLGVLLTMEARWGALRADSELASHPPTSGEHLDPLRTAVAIITLLFFVLLFMPSPFIF